MLERLNDEIEDSLSSSAGTTKRTFNPTEERSKRSVSIPDARAAMERFLAQFGHSCNEYFDTCEAASSLAEGSTQPLPTAAHAQFQVQETLANGHEEDLSIDDAPWKRRRTRQPPGAAILPTEEKKQLPRPRQQRLLISKAKAKRRLPQPSVKFVSEPRTVDDDEVRPDISDAGPPPHRPLELLCGFRLLPTRGHHPGRGHEGGQRLFERRPRRCSVADQRFQCDVLAWLRHHDEGFRPGKFSSLTG
eukprot:s6537_g3.t2